MELKKINLKNINLKDLNPKNMDIKKKVIVGASTVGVVAAVAATAAIGVKLMSKNPIIPEHFTVTAHTGCDGTKDNSLDSITVGLVSGADIVEFDLSFNDEGVAVLCHDEPQGGEATLDEAFALIALYKTLLVNVDVKSTHDLMQVEELARKHGVLDRIFFTGITASDVEAVKASGTGIPYYLNVDIEFGRENNRMYIEELINEAVELGAIGLNFRYTSCSKTIVDMCHEKGLAVSIWTVNNRFDMKKSMSYGADNVTTRKPTVFREIMSQYVEAEAESEIL